MRRRGGMRRSQRLTLTAAIAMLLAGAVRAAEAQTILLQGGRVIPVVGDELESGDVLIKNGLIAAVGASVEAPFEATVIDCRGKVVFPGFVEAHTWRGMDQPNESPPVTPFLNVYDAIDPSQLFFEDSLRDGVTSIHIMAGNNTVIGGMSRVVHPIGMTPDEMTTAADVAMKISLAPKAGWDRMRQMAAFREAFRKLEEDLARLAEKTYEDKLREEKKDLDVTPDEAQARGRALLKPEDIPEEHRNMLRLTRGELRTFAFCGEAMDVPAAIRLAKAHNFLDMTVLVLGGECYKAIDALKAAGRPVVLSEALVYRETDPLSGEEKETFVPGVIDKAGLEYALLRNQGSSLGERYLWYQAARCVREGISRDHAIKAITLWPARMLGLGERLGSIEVGKDANVLVLTGDPLDMQTWVEKVFIQGVEVYERSEDIRLERLFADPASERGPSSQAEGEATTEDNHEIHKGEHDDEPAERPARRERRGRRSPKSSPR